MVCSPTAMTSSRSARSTLVSAPARKAAVSVAMVLFTSTLPRAAPAAPDRLIPRASIRLPSSAPIRIWFRALRVAPPLIEALT